MLALLTAAGLAVGFVAAAPRRRGHAVRRRAGVGAARRRSRSCPSALAIALALGEQGPRRLDLATAGRSLTDPDAATPANDPGRLTAVGSVRARYWDEALQIFKADAGDRRRRRRLRDRAQALPQGRARRPPRPRLRRADAADLGLARACGDQPRACSAPWLAMRARHGPAPPRPRAAVHAGAHRPADARRRRASSSACTRSSTGRGSSPATPCVALLAAGWLAGRGPLARTRRRGARRQPGRRALRAGLRDRPRARRAAAACSPSRSSRRGRRGSRCAPARRRRRARRRSTRGDARRARARERASSARDRNPLAVEPLFELAADRDERPGARSQARRCVGGGCAPAARQPRARGCASPQFELRQRERRAGARSTAIRPALYPRPPHLPRPLGAVP